MKKPSIARSCILVLILLCAQLSNAFSAAPMQANCSMDMSSHVEMMSDETTSDDMAEMDCCDQQASTSCCGDDCHCAKLLSSQTVIENSLIQELDKSHDSRHQAYLFHYKSFYLQQISPPPIV